MKNFSPPTASWRLSWLIRRLAFLLLFAAAWSLTGTAQAQDRLGLIGHSISGKCLDSNGSSVYMSACQPTNPHQQWQRNGNLLTHVPSGKCLDGDGGSSVYMGPCKADNPWQQWVPEGPLLKQARTGLCLDSNGSSIYFGPCGWGNPHQKWDHGVAQAQSLLGLITHAASGKCLDSNGTQVGTSECQPTNTSQQWLRNGNFLAHVPSGNCLDGDGSKVYLRVCVAGNSNQQWVREGPLLKQVSSGLCLDSNGSSMYFGPCGWGNPYQQWDHGAKLTQGAALNCKISDETGKYFGAAGFYTAASPSPAALFTLARLSWGTRTLDAYYLVQNRVNGLCLSREGNRACDTNDPLQQYRITDAAGQGTIKQWIAPYIKFNPLVMKPVVDVFNNPNKPLAPTLLSYQSADDLKVAFRAWGNRTLGISQLTNNGVLRLGSARLECLVYSDRTPSSSSASITEDYILAAKYAQQEGAKALNEVRKSPLGDAEKKYAANLIATEPDIGRRTLKFYDFGAETANDVSIQYLDAGADPLFTHAQRLLGDLIPDKNVFANAVIAASTNYLTTMQAGLDSVPAKTVRGRSLLETGGSQTGLMALQMRLPWELPSAVGALPYLPSNGNFRISFPATGHKSNTASGGLDDNNSYSDFRTNKADGVFNFVATVEVDKDLWTKSRAWGPFLPKVSGGLEFHFAFSVRDNKSGDRVRLDSIAINVIADVSSKGGVVGMAPQIRAIVARLRPLALAEWEIAMGSGRSADVMQPWQDYLSWIAANPYRLDVPIGQDPFSSSLITSDYYYQTAATGAQQPLVLDTAATQLGQEPEVIAAVVGAFERNTLSRTSLNAGLLNVLGEGGLSLKWFNRSFLKEAVCRYNTPSDASCKMVYRDFFSFNPLPDVMEPFVMGQVSSQLNFTFDNVSIPFWPSARPTFSVILPRLQYSAASSYWMAFSKNAAIAMKAGAGQTTNLAN